MHFELMREWILAGLRRATDIVAGLSTQAERNASGTRTFTRAQKEKRFGNKTYK